MKFLLLLIGLFAIKPALPVKQYDVEVTAVNLYWDYKKDKVKAAKKYEGKKIFLHGKVQGRSANLWHVYLHCPDPEGVVATIDDDQLTSVPLYNQGDSFDLICVGAGIVFNLPIVLHCRLPGN